MSSHFLDALNSGRVLLMDGAMGTELQRAGLPAGASGEVWNIRHFDKVQAVHRAYVNAGAEVLLTNTFRANPAAMERFGLRTANADGCWIGALGLMVPLVLPPRTFSDAGPEPYILGDIGPTIDSKTNEEFTDLGFIQQRPWRHLDDFSPDAVLFETCSSPRALDAARAVSGADSVLLSLAFLHDPEEGLITHSGHTPEWFAARARENGIVALGINCGRNISVSDCAEIVRRYRTETDLPLFARPNAGTPTKKAEGWVYPHTPEMMAGQLPELLEAGVSMVGGCCGTTPAHIAAFRIVVDDWNRRPPKMHEA